MSRCKGCPQKKFCKDNCAYCDFGKTITKLNKKIERVYATGFRDGHVTGVLSALNNKTGLAERKIEKVREYCLSNDNVKGSDDLQMPYQIEIDILKILEDAV